ncbi:MAG: FliI/YscN family ATPase [Pseudomonadota bacterium]
MSAGVFDQIRAEAAAHPPVHAIGRVAEIGRGMVLVTGLTKTAAQGDRVGWTRRNQDFFGEIVRLSPAGAQVMASGSTAGLAIGDAVRLLGPATLAPTDQWLGRIVDPDGMPLDDRPLPRGLETRRLDGAPPPAARRRALGVRLQTGMAVFNTLLPIAAGQRLGLFAGSGVGKTTLLGDLARGIEADVIVVAMIGERGRELRDFADRLLDTGHVARTVIVAATSDQSALTRRRCLSSAMVVAEHFRDQGLHVLLLADSITRFAEAHREIALSAGEGASLRGYPPSVAHMVTSLCERAGPGTIEMGDITAIFSVLVAGSDMEEPIADILRGVLDGHVVLDREIAERGRFPAIDLLRSVSRSLPEVATAAENAQIARARRLVGAYENAEIMIQAGMYQAGSDPQVDEAIPAWPLIDAFITEREPGRVEDSFARLGAYLEPRRDPAINANGTGAAP